MAAVTEQARRWLVAAPMLALPTVGNVAGGLTWIWTPSLPLPLLDLLARAGLLDAWLLADLLAALGVLAALRASVVLAAVSAISFAAALAGGGWLPAGYGAAYAAALLISRPRSAANLHRLARRRRAGPRHEQGGDRTGVAGEVV